jgi:uncharacterized Tic20 family protein
MNTTPTTEDRIWAVISHLSPLAFGMGIVLPIIGWSDQRRKSNYASFQSLQALGYQSLGFTVWIFSYLVIIISASILLLIMLGSRGGNSQNMDADLVPWMIVIFIVLFGFFAIYLLLPIVAAAACMLGKDFRYPILGDRLARYLGYDPSQSSGAQSWLNEDHEFRWVVAMGHFSILITLWGMLAPLTAWILYGKRNFFLRFQSVQTLIYQAVTTILFLGAGFLYLFGFLSLIALTGLMGEPTLNSPIAMFGVIIFGVSLLIVFVMVLLVPLMHIVGQWAGYRVLKGDNYRYPLVGRLVGKWISNKSTIEEKPA